MPTSAHSWKPLAGSACCRQRARHQADGADASAEPNGIPNLARSLPIDVICQPEVVDKWSNDAARFTRTRARTPAHRMTPSAVDPTVVQIGMSANGTHRGLSG